MLEIPTFMICFSRTISVIGRGIGVEDIKRATCAYIILTGTVEIGTRRAIPMKFVMGIG